ncbi:hypothetical protein P7C70_g5834, partial [Phenoliferia sp. Uapishka_3]
MTSKWLSSSISSAIHHLTGNQSDANTLEHSAGLPDGDLAFADKPSRPKHKSGSSSRSQSSSRASTSQSSDNHSFSTPPQPSPRTRVSLGSSAVLTGILESHPAFSVFRKSSSLQSLDSVASSNPDDYAAAQSSYSNRASPSKTPAKRRMDDDESPPVENGTANPDASDEWHLSSVEEMASLNWGDRSGESSDAAGEANNIDTNAFDANNGSAVRLVQYDSPPSRRMSTSKSPRASTQVQFSPLSLAPSPLVGAPRPPPPPTLDPLDDDSPSSRAAVRTILKLPRTPGTGQSVRFSSSTRETTPPSLARFADAHHDEDDIEEEPSMDDHGDSSTSSGGSSRAVASFLSKLQAAIPSPENSLVEQQEYDQSNISPTTFGPNPLLVVSSPTTSELQNPPGIGAGRPPLFAEDESNLFDTSAPHFSRLQSVEDWSVADAREEQNEGKELSEDLIQFQTPEQVFSSPDESPTFTSPTPAPKPLATAPLATSPLASSTNSANRSSTSSPSSSANSTLTPERSISGRRSTSFYRQFLKKRASTGSFVAADELGRLIEREGERTPSPRASAESSNATFDTPPKIDQYPTSPGSLKRSANEMDDEGERHEEVTLDSSVYFSPGAYDRSEDVAASPLAPQSGRSFEVHGEEFAEESSSDGVEASLLSELGVHRGNEAPIYEQDVTGGYAPSMLLPAIYEESEPNTTVESISFAQSPPTIIPFGSNPRRRSTSHPLSS